MTHSNQRIGHRLLRGGVLAGLAVAAVFTTVDVAHVSAAATQGPDLALKSGGNALTSGGSATSVALTQPVGAACTGDTLAGYKVQSYMVPASVDPSTLTFNGSGPIPVATGNPTPSAFREPLYSTTGTPIINKNVAVGTGLLTNLPPINFAVLAASDIPAGVYNLGYACTIGTAGPTQLDKYWNVKVSFGPDSLDPNGFSWDLIGPSAPTTAVPTAVTTTSIDFSYGAPDLPGVSAVTDYAYRYGTSATGPWTDVDTLSATPGAQQITGLTARTQYYVQVQAKNATKSGYRATITTATLAGAPGTPAGTSGNSSVSLTWAAPATDGGAAVTYKVEYTSNDGGTWSTATSSAATTSFNVTGLTNGVAYKFRVSANTAGGTGAASSTSAAVTPFGAPAAPTALAVAALTTTSADLTWTAPSDNGGSAITDYSVQYSLTGGAPWTTVSHVASTTAAITVTGLTARTAYTFQVAAVNAPVGAGTFASTTGTTIADAPGTPAIGALGNGTVAVSWSAPVGTAAVTYNLETTANNGVTWVSKATGLTSVSTTVSGLVNGTSYRFRVAAVDAGGTSAVSATSAAGIPRTTASAAGKPAVTPGVASVKLTWTIPTSNGGAAITSYVVQKSTNGSTWVTVTSAAPLTRTFTVTGLVNGTKYYFRVAAKNTAGVGAYSVANTAVPRTVPTAPGKPVVTTAKTSVKLTWTAPKSTGGSVITGYVVQKSLDGVHWTTVTTAAPLTRVYTATGLITKKAYRFRVAAKNVAGTGAYSLVTAATPH